MNAAKVASKIVSFLRCRSLDFLPPSSPSAGAQILGANPAVDPGNGGIRGKWDRRLLEIALGAVLLGQAAVNAWAGAGAVDPSFNPDIRAAGSVLAIASQPDGKLVVGGQFVFANQSTRVNLARLGPDGTLDPDFGLGAGADNSISKIGILGDGGILVAGSFRSIHGQSAGRIARLDSSGAIDPAFRAGAGADSTVSAFDIGPNGQIVVAGFFSTFDGQPRKCVARLNPDGSLDESFQVGAGPNSGVEAILALPDGKVVLGGRFTTVGGVARGYLARLNADGSLDSSFDPANTLNNSVFFLARQNDGKILVGGSFSGTGTGGSWRLARFLSNGSLDQTFNAGSTFSGSSLFCFALQTDGGILCDGGKGVVRLSAAGSLDKSFTQTPYSAPSGALNRAAAILPVGGGIIVAGNFVTMGGSRHMGLARLGAGGAVDSTFNPEFTSFPDITSVLVQPDRKILLGGTFVSVNGVARNHVARLNSDGSLDLSFDAKADVTGSSCTLGLQPDGKILVGSIFYRSPTNALVRLNANGSYDPSFNTGAGPTGSIYALGLLDGGGIVAGGLFSTFNKDTKQNYVTRLQANGSVDTGFDDGTGPCCYVDRVWIDSSQRVLIRGGFSTVNGVHRSGFARLGPNGALDEAFDPAAAADGALETALPQADGTLVVGGWFSAVAGVGRNRLARFLADGSLDPSWNPGLTGPDVVYALAQGADGKIVFGRGTLAQRQFSVGRLNRDGSIDTSFDSASTIRTSSVSQVIRALAVQPDGGALVVGQFDSVAGLPRTSIARFLGDPLPALAARPLADRSLRISWPLAASDARLEFSHDLSPQSWHPVAALPAVDGDSMALTLPPSETARFFRLAK